MLQQPTHFQHYNQSLWLSAERCIFWEEEKWLIVSDIHFGKSGHFRKAGIAIPQTVFKEDLHRLVTQIQFFKPEQLIVVGDFFHSHLNKELKLFEKWRKDLESLPIHLVKGNHDILEQQWYAANKIEIHAVQLTKGPFAFMHELPEPKTVVNEYIFTGHIHPGIHIAGLGKQSLRFPCFYFAERYAVLPAFGRFTGLHAIKPKKKDKIFAIADQRIVGL